jgi:drug/metabolite transporter superfamily protein YnfA
MLQRIQTIFLLLAALLMIAAGFLPLWVKIEGNTQSLLTAMYFVTQSVENGKVVATLDSQNTMYLLGIAFGSALFVIYAIFQYKDRKRQMLLVVVNSFIIILFGALATIQTYQHEGSYQIGYFTIIAALFFNQLARLFIARDEQKVRSADRLR